MNYKQKACNEDTIYKSSLFKENTFYNNLQLTAPSFLKVISSFSYVINSLFKQKNRYMALNHKHIYPAKKKILKCQTLMIKQLHYLLLFLKPNVQSSSIINMNYLLFLQIMWVLLMNISFKLINFENKTKKNKLNK